MLISILHEHDSAGHLPPPTHQPIINITHALPAIGAVIPELPLPTTPATPSAEKLHLELEGPELSKLLQLPPSAHAGYPKASLDITFHHQPETTFAHALQQYVNDISYGFGEVTTPTAAPPELQEFEDIVVSARAFVTFALLREPPAPGEKPDFELGVMQFHYNATGYVVAPILTQSLKETRSDMNSVLAHASTLSLAYFTSESMLPFTYDEAVAHIPYRDQLMKVTTKVLRAQ